MAGKSSRYGRPIRVIKIEERFDAPDKPGFIRKMGLGKIVYEGLERRTGETNRKTERRKEWRNKKSGLRDLFSDLRLTEFRELRPRDIESLSQKKSPRIKKEWLDKMRADFFKEMIMPIMKTQKWAESEARKYFEKANWMALSHPLQNEGTFYVLKYLPGKNIFYWASTRRKGEKTGERRRRERRDRDVIVEE